MGRVEALWVRSGLLFSPEGCGLGIYASALIVAGLLGGRTKDRATLRVGVSLISSSVPVG